MSQETYSLGEVVTVSSARLTNVGVTAAPIELKVWAQVPNGPLVSMVNTGADGSFQLSAGSDQNFGPIALFPVMADTPRGEYEINCRILNPPTGELLSEDLNSFAIR